MLRKYQRFTPKPRYGHGAKKARELAYEGALLGPVAHHPAPASSLGERKLACAILESTYTDLQKSARVHDWEDAMSFTQGGTPEESARFTWMCDTLNVNEEWVRAQLLRVAQPPLALDLPPPSRRRTPSQPKNTHNTNIIKEID